MHQPDTRLKREISKYLEHMTDLNLTPGHVQCTRRMLLRFWQHCLDQGIKSAGRVRPEDFKSFMNRFSSLSGSYQAKNYTLVRSFLIYCKNVRALDYRLRVKGCRKNIDWLNPVETEAILATPVTAREAVLLRGGLLQGLRKAEILKITLDDAENALKTSNLQVFGKGRKYRLLPLHIGFAEALKALLDRTDRLPSESLVGIGGIRAWEIVVSFSLRFGRRFSVHTLRRTFGRNLWLRGIPIETIGELFGHSSTDTTRLYLGLNLTDMRKAISEYGTKSELRIIDDVPQRRIAPTRLLDMPSASD